MLFQGKVVGIVTQAGQKFNYAAPAMTARFAVEGWSVRLPEKIAQEEKSETESTRQSKLESRETTVDREMTGKGGASSPFFQFKKITTPEIVKPPSLLPKPRIYYWSCYRYERPATK